MTVFLRRFDSLTGKEACAFKSCRMVLFDMTRIHGIISLPLCIGGKKSRAKARKEDI